MGDVSPHYNVDKLNGDGALKLMNSEDGKGRVFAFENEIYKVISSSIVAGAIANGDSLNFKPYLFSEFVNYFMGYNPVTALQENINEMLSGTVYPNPVKNETNIEFSLSEADHIRVEICNANGQVLKTLTNKYYQPGNYTLRWTINSELNRSFEYGYYLCRIISSEQVITRKLILID